MKLRIIDFYNQNKRGILITGAIFFAWLLIILSIFLFSFVYKIPFHFSPIESILIPFVITIFGSICIQYEVLKFIFTKNNLRNSTYNIFVGLHAFYGIYFCVTQNPAINGLLVLMIFIISYAFWGGSFGFKETLVVCLFFYFIFYLFLQILRIEFGNDEIIMSITFTVSSLVFSINNESAARFKKTLSIKTKELDYSLKETKDLLDPINTSVFTIGKNLEVIHPVSKSSNEIFGMNIIGKKVTSFLFPSIRSGTKNHRDLMSVFHLIFGENDIQYDGISGHLPKKVTIPCEFKKRGKTFKISYHPIFDQNDLLEKLMFTVEDITESEVYLKTVEEDQKNFKFMDEILETENKDNVAKDLEISLNKLFDLLEDFTSPLSDTYSLSYFQTKLENQFDQLHKKFEHQKEIKTMIFGHIANIEHFEFFKNIQDEINPQIEATNIICDSLDFFLKYATVFNRFFPVNLNLNRNFTKIIIEKVRDLDKVFQNLFEYIFLVREISQISDAQYKKAIQAAKLYPEFDRTIDLIYQRSRLLSFFCLGTGEDELSKTYDDLSYLVGQMPNRSNLSDYMIKRNLIDPYKIVLEKTRNIEKEIIKRDEIRKKEALSDFGYYQLLYKLLKRFEVEKRGETNPNLPPLPLISAESSKGLVSFVKTMEVVLKNYDSISKGNKLFKKDFNLSIERQINHIEVFIIRSLLNDLKKKNAFPPSRNNQNFIEYIKNLISNKNK
ncbi:MAG: hypothetical protein VXY34_10305 [Bdellovibrionota bacterium]|nr:hypothetical protein [Bdellovibrionota bacterium]